MVAERNIKVAVRNQSWQRGKNGAVELLVRMIVPNLSDQELQMRFDLDPQTQLPKAATLEGDAAASGMVQFAYPSDGPRNIYVLGVSRDFPVVAASDVAAVVAGDVASMRRH